jgi:hypothetical protein
MSFLIGVTHFTQAVSSFREESISGKSVNCVTPILFKPTGTLVSLYGD